MPLPSEGRSEVLLATVAGTWADACPCSIPCPCWKTHKANVDACVNIHALSLRTARFRDFVLPHTTFVLVFLPSQPWAAPSPVTLYVSQSANAGIARATEDVVTLLYGARLPATPVPLFTSLSTKRWAIKIPGILDYDVRMVPGERAHPDVQAYLYSWLSDPIQGVAHRVRYTSASVNREYHGTNGLVAALQFPPKTARRTALEWPLGLKTSRSDHDEAEAARAADCNSWSDTPNHGRTCHPQLRD